MLWCSTVIAGPCASSRGVFIQAIVGMAGNDWSQAYIQAGMEQYIAECGVHHCEVIE